MQSLRTKQAGQVREALSDIPFVNTIKTAGMFITFLLLTPYLHLNTDYADIINPAAIIGVGSACTIISFILDSNLIEQRKKELLDLKKEYKKLDFDEYLAEDWQKMLDFTEQIKFIFYPPKNGEESYMEIQWI